jgi:hypothetical protein
MCAAEAAGEACVMSLVVSLDYEVAGGIVEDVREQGPRSINLKLSY